MSTPSPANQFQESLRKAISAAIRDGVSPGDIGFELFRFQTAVEEAEQLGFEPSLNLRVKN